MVMPTLRSNTYDYKIFEQQTSFLKAEVDAKNARRTQLKAGKHTNVSRVNKQYNSKNLKPGNRNSGAILKQKVGGKVIEGCSYEAKEQRHLSNSQQKAVKKLRQKSVRLSSFT